MQVVDWAAPLPDTFGIVADSRRSVSHQQGTDREGGAKAGQSQSGSAGEITRHGGGGACRLRA